MMHDYGHCHDAHRHDGHEATLVTDAHSCSLQGDIRQQVMIRPGLNGIRWSHRTCVYHKQGHPMEAPLLMSGGVCNMDKASRPRCRRGSTSCMPQKSGRVVARVCIHWHALEHGGNPFQPKVQPWTSVCVKISDSLCADAYQASHSHARGRCCLCTGQAWITHQWVRRSSKKPTGPVTAKVKPRQQSRMHGCYTEKASNAWHRRGTHRRGTHRRATHAWVW